MKIGQFTEYRGYVGSIEYEPEDNIYYGKLLDIDDLVNYHANNIIYLEKHYQEAVDDYIEFKKELHEIEDTESNKTPDIYIGDREEDMGTIDSEIVTKWSMEFINKFKKIWSDNYT